MIRRSAISATVLKRCLPVRMTGSAGAFPVLTIASPLIICPGDACLLCWIEILPSSAMTISKACLGFAESFPADWPLNWPGKSDSVQVIVLFVESQAPSNMARRIPGSFFLTLGSNGPIRISLRSNPLLLGDAITMHAIICSGSSAGQPQFMFHIATIPA